MKTIWTMMLVTGLFVACNVVCAHPVMASYEECVGDMEASWEGEECTWVREHHPAYRLDVMLDSVIDHNPQLFAYATSEVVIIVDPSTGDSKPVIIISDD